MVIPIPGPTTERFQKFDELDPDCSGDEYSPGADGQFVDAPVFRWNDGELHFSNGLTNSANGRYGSASGFLPQE